MRAPLRRPNLGHSRGAACARLRFTARPVVSQVRIGKNETLHSDEDHTKVKIDDCDTDPKATHRDAKTGALHHNVSPKVEARLKKFFEPYNQRLYKFLGRDLGW